ncbi:YfbU family protein [Aeromonas sobria]|uniref:YfbU family protein n=1 Tax=Aeromonas sobria TaxID=646 RepID=UPI0013969B98|nr:YfbU family protein [Aeromonas sobria]
MNFTPEQRLIVGMLCDIHQKLEIRNSFDPELITDAIQSGNEWAIDLQYGEYLGSEITDPRFNFICSLLAMCETIENSYASFSPDAQEAVKAGTIFDASNAFIGFDGNNESEYMSAARFLVNKTGRFADFEGRKFNSHAPSIDGYKRMLVAFDRVHEAFTHRLTVEQIIEIMNERIHPSNR